MCPLPVVSSASTTLPAASRRTSPSLVSNSISPVSQSTSKRCGWIVPIDLTHARGHAADVAPRRREVVGKAQWRIVFEKLPWL